MTKIEILKKAKEEYELAVKAMESTPDCVPISSFSGTVKSIFVEETTYEENMRYLHEFRKHMDFTLKRYYMGHNGLVLALSYEGDEFDVVFFCTDVENALQKVSGGKCYVQSTESKEITREVVCKV